MRKSMSCALLFVVGHLFGPRTGAQTVRVPIGEYAGKPVVQIWLNGTGPYDFILDTGASVTLVQRQLLQQLHIPAHDPVSIRTVSGGSFNQRGVAQTIALGGIHVEHLEVDTLEPTQLYGNKRPVRGLLGENFLNHFDILIDNEKRMLTLDSTSGLAETLVGEHLQASRFDGPSPKSLPDRIVVQLTVPSFLHRPLLFLVDSGADIAMLYPSLGQAWRPTKDVEQVYIRALNVTQNCQVETTTLEIGGGRFPGTPLATCKGLTRGKSDLDGLLPTRGFHQLFISHRGGYVIANPHQPARPAEATEQAGLSKRDR
jgi:predicted aspartyl protease